MEKCCPRVGSNGEVMVKPNRGKKDTVSSTATDRRIFFVSLNKQEEEEDEASADNASKVEKRDDLEDDDG